MGREGNKSNYSDFAKSKNHIPGIYNYCDRWCDRCSYTGRCLHYTQENGMSGKESLYDHSNEKFWEQLRLSFDLIYQPLAVRIEGISLDNGNRQDTKGFSHLSADAEKLAREYSLRMVDWLRNKNEIVSENAKRFLALQDEILVGFKDALEVVQWYSIFISVKIQRAYFDLDASLETDDEIAIGDNLGSAKIALVAIDRSIEALTVLFRYLSEDEDKILNFLALLSKIKKLMFVTFPDAMEYKRPGFDDY